MTTPPKEKTSAAKDLLQAHSSPLNSASLFDGMLIAGLLEVKSYVSSSGSGEIKSYESLTEQGLKYGVNRASRFSEKTDARFYASTFKDLLVVVSKAILAHSESL